MSYCDLMQMTPHEVDTIVAALTAREQSTDTSDWSV